MRNISEEFINDLEQMSIGTNYHEPLSDDWYARGEKAGADRRSPSYNIIPGNILSAKLGIVDYDWGVVAPNEYRNTVHSLHLPVSLSGHHILDPRGNGTMVALYDNIIPGKYIVDWISLFMPRISTLDLYVSPSMFSMVKDVSNGKTDLMPHEHHMMTIWPRSWQGNNFLLTRGKLFKNLNSGVEIDGMLDGMELPFGLNDGIIHDGVKINSMRRVTSKHTIGVIHNNIKWRFDPECVAYAPTISRPYTTCVMGHPFRHISNLPKSFDYVKEEYEEYVLGFTKNKPYYLEAFAGESIAANGNTSVVKPWRAYYGKNDNLNVVKFDLTYSNRQIRELNMPHWLYMPWLDTLDDIKAGDINAVVKNHGRSKHLLKMHYAVMPVVYSQSVRYRSNDHINMLEWDNLEGVQNYGSRIKSAIYAPYNLIDYNVYKTGFDHGNISTGGKQSRFYKGEEGHNINGKSYIFTPYNDTTIDSEFIGIHNIRRIFSYNSKFDYVEKLIIPWLDAPYDNGNEIRSLQTTLNQTSIKRKSLEKLSKLADRVNKDPRADEYNSNTTSHILMPVPLDYALNGVQIGNYDEIKAKWRYEGAPMIFKRKGGITTYNGTPKDDRGEYSAFKVDDEKLIFYCPYRIPESYIRDGKLKFRLAIISEDTFKQERHTDVGRHRNIEFYTPDISGRDFITGRINKAVFKNVHAISYSADPVQYYTDTNSNISYPVADNTPYDKAYALSGHKIKRDFIQPVPGHKHPYELVKNGSYLFMNPNPDDDDLNMYYDTYEKNYSDYYNMCNSNLGGSNRQLTSYPKTITMLSYTSFKNPSDPVDPDSCMRGVVIDSPVFSWSGGGNGNMEIEAEESVFSNKDKEYLTRIIVDNPNLTKIMRAAGPDASIMVISNVPLFLEGASYIGGTFPLESEHAELLNQRTQSGADTIESITPSFETVKRCCFMKLSTGFELDDAFIENGKLFNWLCKFMQTEELYKNVMYKVNPHLLQPTYRKGDTTIGGVIDTVKVRPQEDITRILHDTQGYWQGMNEMYDYNYAERKDYYFPFINVRWCMAFMYDKMPRTIKKISDVDIFGMTYIPDNLILSGIDYTANKETGSVKYTPEEAKKYPPPYSYIIQSQAVWVPDLTGKYEKMDLGAKYLLNHRHVFTNSDSVKNNLDGEHYLPVNEEYYEWSIDGKIDGIQYNAIQEAYEMYYEKDPATEVKHDLPFDMRLDEFIDFYSNWTYADSSIGPEDTINVRWEIDLVTRVTVEGSTNTEFFNGRADIVYNGKAKDLVNWNGLKFTDTKNAKMKQDLTNSEFGSPVVKAIRVYSKVYVCPTPNWERGMWGILRGVLPKGADSRCVVIPQRCTEGIFYRGVDLSKGIVLGEYNGSLPEKLFWGTDKDKLNVSGIFASTHNSNPHSHRTRRNTLRGYNTSEVDMVYDNKFPYLWSTKEECNIITNKFKQTLINDDSKHKLVNKKYGINIHKLNTPAVILDDDNIANLNKNEAKGIYSSYNHDIWRITKRSEFGNIFLNSDGKSYDSNFRPSVTTVNDVSPMSLPHLFDEIYIDKLGGFGDLHELYSDDPFGITPYAYINHRPMTTFNKAYNLLLFANNGAMLKAMPQRNIVIIMLAYAFFKNTNKEKISSITSLIPELSVLNETILSNVENRNITYRFKNRLNLYTPVYNDNNVLETFMIAPFADMFKLQLSKISISNESIDRFLAEIKKQTNEHILKSVRITDVFTKIFKELDPLPKDYNDLWLNLTGSNIFDKRFKATGDTMFSPSNTTPIASIFSKYTMLNGVAKVRDRNSYVFSEHQYGVMYTHYDRYATTRFDHTDFDQSYYIIQSNIRRSNVFKVYHQGIDYTKGEKYRFMSKIHNFNNYPSDIRLEEIIKRLYGEENSRVRTPNIRSAYTTGPILSLENYSKSSMYYRSTLINEAVGEIVEVGSAMPIAGPFYYNLHQTATRYTNDDIFDHVQEKYINLTDKSSSVYKRVKEANISDYTLVRSLMNSSVNGRRHFYAPKYAYNGEINELVESNFPVITERGGVYKTLRDAVDTSLRLKHGVVGNYYRTPYLGEESEVTSVLADANIKHTPISVHQNSIRLPEYYSNWANGGITSTTAYMYDVMRKANTRYLLANTSLANISLDAVKVIAKDYNGIMNSDSFYNQVNNEIRENRSYLYKNYHDSKLTKYGFLYKSDFALLDGVEDSLLLNIKSYSNFMRSGGGKHKLYNRVIYPFTRNIIDEKNANTKEMPLSPFILPNRMDTNYHIVLSNIQSINSFVGDLDETLYLDDVSSRVNEITFSETMVHSDNSFKGAINTPVSISPFIQKFSVMTNPKHIYWYRSEFTPPISVYTNERYTSTNEYEMAVDVEIINDNLNSKRILGKHQMTQDLWHTIVEKGESGFNGNIINPKFTSQTSNYYISAERYDSVSADINDFNIVAHEGYIDKAPVDQQSYVLKTDRYTVSPYECMIYKKRYQTPYYYNLTYVPCLKRINFNGTFSTSNIVLGENMLRCLHSNVLPPMWKSIDRVTEGVYNVVPVVSDFTKSHPTWTSAWINTKLIPNTVSGNKKFDYPNLNNLVLSAQFNGLPVENRTEVPKIIHRMYGKGIGYPTSQSNILGPLKITAENTFRRACIFPKNMQVLKGRIDEVKNYVNQHALLTSPSHSVRRVNYFRMNHDKVVISDKIDLYDLFYKFIQHNPINPTEKIWNAPNERFGNRFDHILEFTDIWNNVSTKLLDYVNATIMPENHDNVTINGEYEYNKGGTRNIRTHYNKAFFLFPNTPWYFSRPLYKMSLSENDNLILLKADTPKVYDRDSGTATYSAHNFVFKQSYREFETLLSNIPNDIITKKNEIW